LTFILAKKKPARIADRLTSIRERLISSF